MATLWSRLEEKRPIDEYERQVQKDPACLQYRPTVMIGTREVKCSLLGACVVKDLTMQAVWLLDQHAFDVDESLIGAFNLLRYATLRANIELVKQLVNRGASLTVENERGETLLEEIRRQRRERASDVHTASKLDNVIAFLQKAIAIENARPAKRRKSRHGSGANTSATSDNVSYM